MRKIVTALCSILTGTFMTTAEADRFHLPCDPNAAVSLGTGIFTGRTRSADLGAVEFERIQWVFLRGEFTLFDNCGRDARDHFEVTRNWFGRLAIYGSISPENARLGFAHAPDVIKDKDGNVVYQTDGNGDPVVDANGQPVPRTENTLIKADLETGTDWSGGVGARLSIYDGKHFHVEAFGEAAGTFNGNGGWNEVRAKTVVTHALEIDLDVTKLMQEHAAIRYRWGMTNIGVTVGVPFRPNTVAKNRLTPFISFGRMWFKAEVDVSLDRAVTHDLMVLGVNVGEITERRNVNKESWSGLLGARLDFNRNFSLEASAMGAKTDNTLVYWISASSTLRF